VETLDKDISRILVNPHKRNVRGWGRCFHCFKTTCFTNGGKPHCMWPVLFYLYASDGQVGI